MRFQSGKFIILVLSCAFAIKVHGQSTVENGQSSSIDNQVSSSDSNSQSSILDGHASTQDASSSNYRQMNRALLRQKLNGVSSSTLESASHGPRKSSNMSAKPEASIAPEKGSLTGMPNLPPTTTTGSTNSFSGRPRAHASGFPGGDISTLKSLNNSSAFAIPMPATRSSRSASENGRAGSRSKKKSLMGGRQKNGMGLSRTLSPQMRKKAAAVKKQHAGMGRTSQY